MATELPHDPLQELKDIHLPEAISSWPSAPGYIALEVVFMVLILWLFMKLYQHHQAHAAKRQALRELKQLHAHYLTTQALIPTCAQINQLLKRVALAYHPRVKVADLYQDAWIQFLEDHSQKLSFRSLRFFLVQYPYQKNYNASLHHPQQIERLFETARRWIQQQRKRP
jgi:hypothetical protein